MLDINDFDRLVTPNDFYQARYYNNTNISPYMTYQLGDPINIANFTDYLDKNGYEYIAKQFGNSVYTTFSIRPK